MFALFIVGICCIIIAFLVWLVSDGDLNQFCQTLSILGTICVLIVATNAIIDEPNGIKVDVPEEYWNGDVNSLEVYRRTEDSVFIRFKDSAYNKSLKIK